MRRYVGWFLERLPCCPGELENQRDDGHLAFERIRKVFDDRIGENVGGDALNLGLGCIGREGIFEGKNEVFALTNVGDCGMVQAAEGVGDGLPLGIEHRALECDVDVGLHSKIIRELGKRGSAFTVKSYGERKMRQKIQGELLAEERVMSKMTELRERVLQPGWILERGNKPRGRDAISHSTRRKQQKDSYA
jgi:hypothetical protein